MLFLLDLEFGKIGTKIRDFSKLFFFYKWTILIVYNMCWGLGLFVFFWFGFFILMGLNGLWTQRKANNAAASLYICLLCDSAFRFVLEKGAKVTRTKREKIIMMNTLWTVHSQWIIYCCVEWLVAKGIIWLYIYRTEN